MKLKFCFSTDLKFYGFYYFLKNYFNYDYENSKGAGSYSGQGGANRANGASRAPEANRGQRGRIMKKGILHVLLL